MRPWNDPDADARRALATDASILLAAKRDGRLVGTVMAGADGHRGWVYYLAVAPAFRGRGIASALLAAAETWCAETGMPRLNLMVREGAPELLQFYTRRGYRQSYVTVLQKEL